MNLPEENILPFIPQRPPFVMVDKLLYCDETTARTSFTVRPDNIFVEDGELREPGLAENIAQTAATRSGYASAAANEPTPVGYIGAIKNLEIMALPKTGDKLMTEIKIVNQVFDVTLISGKVFCDERLMAQCEMKIFINQIKQNES
jgi:predicted hotdog family 3-hydroxylacyl-ACP dehydratase